MRTIVMVILAMLALSACAEMENSGGLFTQQELDNLRNRDRPIERTVEQRATAEPRCGDEIINNDEQCDPPGAAVVGGACTQNCKVICSEGSWDATERRCNIPVELKCPDAQGVLCGMQIKPTRGAGHCGIGTWCPEEQVCKGGACVEGDMESLCTESGGTWKSFSNSCADFCWAAPVPLPEPVPGPIDTPSFDTDTLDLQFEANGITGYATLGELDAGIGTDLGNIGGEPSLCPAAYDPVCAIKGGAVDVYSNACVAGNAGATVLCSGDCPCDFESIGSVEALLAALNKLDADCVAVEEWSGAEWEAREQPGFALGKAYKLACNERQRVTLTGNAPSSITVEVAAGDTPISVPFEDYDAEELLTRLNEAGGDCGSVEDYESGDWMPVSGDLVPGEVYKVVCQNPTTTTLSGTPVSQVEVVTGDVMLGIPFSNIRVKGQPPSAEKLCADVVTESCDCGPDACWNGQRCVGKGTTPAPVCGDGTISASEECEPSIPLMDDEAWCSNCKVSCPSTRPHWDGTYCTTEPAATCGDGILQGDEECEVTAEGTFESIPNGNCEACAIICESEYYAVDGECVPETTIPTPQPSCPDGYEEVGGICQPSSSGSSGNLGAALG